jgi:hypothetical protein
MIIYFLFQHWSVKNEAADRKVSLYFEAEFLMQAVLIQRRLPNGEWWLFVENVNFS